MHRTVCIVLCLLSLYLPATAQKRVRDYGIVIGVMKPGNRNSITDVPGVLVGHVTLNANPSMRTGVTAIIPHSGNLFQQKVPAATYTGNGFGKMTGSTQIAELGNLETPIVLTNTLSVPVAMEALVTYTLAQPGNEKVQSVNAVVGETNDGYLNDIRSRFVRVEDALQAIRNAGPDVREGSVGAGTGTICFGYKGGIGTSSRRIPASLGGYTVGVLVQSNFGGVLQIAGAPVGRELGQYFLSDKLNDPADGSCMIIVATDAPLDHRNLERLAKRALLGLGRTGGIGSNGSGDYVIAFSTNEKVRVTFESANRVDSTAYLRNDAVSPLFLAVIESTEEAILNSMFMSETMVGFQNHRIEALPMDKVVPLLTRYNVIKR